MTTACPICARPAAAYPENPASPFCSARCKTIDMGNWIDGRYRLDDDAPEIPPPGTGSPATRAGEQES